MIKFIKDGDELVSEDYFTFKGDDNCYAEIGEGGDFLILSSKEEVLHSSTAMMPKSLAQETINSLAYPNEIPFQAKIHQQPAKINRDFKTSSVERRFRLKFSMNLAKGLLLAFLVLVLTFLWGYWGLAVGSLWLVGVYGPQKDKLISRFGWIGGAGGTLILSLLSSII